jgi:flagellar biosynthesis chaperone FliJ
VSFTNDQKHQLNKLIDYRDEMTNALFHIERIIKEYFPEEFEVAYQHWIPQITTALYEDKKWLSRGEHTLQQTINRLLDKSQNSDNKGVSRYI